MTSLVVADENERLDIHMLYSAFVLAGLPVPNWSNKSALHNFNFLYGERKGLNFPCKLNLRFIILWASVHFCA